MAAHAPCAPTPPFPSSPVSAVLMTPGTSGAPVWILEGTHSRPLRHVMHCRPQLFRNCPLSPGGPDLSEAHKVRQFHISLRVLTVALGIVQP